MNCYLTKVYTKSVILIKKLVGEVIYESAKFEVTKLLYTKSYFKHVSDNSDNFQILISIILLSKTMYQMPS